MGKGSFSLAIALVAALTAQAPPPQPDRARVDAAAQRAAERLRALRREADSLASQERTLLVELRTLEVQREMKSEELARIQSDLKATRTALDAAAARASALGGQADAERPEIEARLVQLYKMGGAGYWRLLLDVDDVRSVGRAYRTAAALTRIDRDRVQEHRRTLEALARERQALEAHARQATALQAQALGARASIGRIVAERSALVESIDARRDLNAQLTGELEAAQQRLHAAIAQLGSGRGVGAVTLPLRPFRGALAWPAPGVVTGRFGRQTTGRYGTGISRNGIEISMGEGQQIHAIHEGTVAFADPFTGYGNLVILDHGDGAFSLYGYLSEVGVSRGDRLDARAPVGLSGRNPNGNPALYFELRVDGKPVDPLQWLKKP